MQKVAALEGNNVEDFVPSHGFALVDSPSVEGAGGRHCIRSVKIGGSHLLHRIQSNFHRLLALATFAGRHVNACVCFPVKWVV